MATGFAALDDADPAAPAQRPTRRLENGYGRHIDTPYTDLEAVKKIDAMPATYHGRSAAVALADEWRRWGVKMFDWKIFKMHDAVLKYDAMQERLAAAERIRLEAEEQAKYGNEPSNFDPVSTCRVEGIAGFLAAGANRLYSIGKVLGARVTFESGQFLVSIHSTARDRTRWPGGFLVTGCTGFGEPNTPLARIDANGHLYFADAGRLCPELHALLEAFNENPANFVSRMGLATERCCFCRIELTDPISTTMGYGPICAGHYGLPWSKEAMAAKREMKCAAVAPTATDEDVASVPLP